MLHTVGFALMVSLHRDAEENKNIYNQKMTKKQHCKPQKQSGIEGQGPTNIELSNKISCTKTNDRPVKTKPKDKYWDDFDNTQLIMKIQMLTALSLKLA